MSGARILRFVARTLLALPLTIALTMWAGAVANAHPPNIEVSNDSQFQLSRVEHNSIFYHLLLDQLEGRANGPDNKFRWSGEGWIGTDMNKLWFKSEGFVEHRKMTDGAQEVLYNRPIPYLRYFDFQAGVRVWYQGPDRVGATTRPTEWALVVRRVRLACWRGTRVPVTIMA